MRLLPILSALLLAGCEKITVLECDDASHADSTTADGSVKDDASPVDTGQDTDGGDNPDGGGMDASNPGCAPGSYCIDDLVPSLDVANVREAVTFTPTVRDNGQQLTFSGMISEIRATRRPELPPAELGDLEMTFAVDPATGTAQFLIAQVPTWFSTTTFTIRVHAQAAGGPDVSAEASVTVRGNVVVSGVSEVFAIASDGLPALSENFTAGRFISGASFVDEPEDLWLARDGTLLVYDQASAPPRIRRFALDGENSQLPDFQFEDQGVPIISTNNGGTGMVQLSDGRVALVDYQFTRAQESIIRVWNEDGTYSHSVNAPDPMIDWSGLGADDMGHLFVLENETGGRLLEIDPATGFELDVVTTDLNSAYNLLWRPDGSFYVGLYGSMIRVTPQGGKQMINGLPSASDIYRHLAPFGSARVLTVRNSSSDFNNVLIIENTDNLGNLRRENVGGAFFVPYGIAFLD